jgi:murein DD-endopeptidase MepM/ murein hydrolase activator NlpD
MRLPITPRARETLLTSTASRPRRSQIRRKLGTRAVLSLALLLVAAGPAAATAPKSAVPTLIFPVAGPTTYSDDFGAPRAGGPHQGIDILATKKTPVVAVESGKVKLWTTSASAGCMLYLYGDSGTMYEYIHLNNDLTMQNDNRGKCVAGVAYARGMKDGVRVQAGQQLGYVGDSGDANGIHAHLHFEVHPSGGAAVDGFPFLQSAQHLLFFAKKGAPFTLALTGTVVAVAETSLTLTLSDLQAFPANLKLHGLTQTLTVSVPASASVLFKSSAGPAPRLLAAYAGEPVVIWTTPALATLKAMLGASGALSAALVQLS